jgi:hypothetical protein
VNRRQLCGHNINRSGASEKQANCPNLDGPSRILEKVCAVGHELAFLASSDAPDLEDGTAFAHVRDSNRRTAYQPRALKRIDKSFAILFDEQADRLDPNSSQCHTSNFSEPSASGLVRLKSPSSQNLFLSREKPKKGYA